MSRIRGSTYLFFLAGTLVGKICLPCPDSPVSAHAKTQFREYKTARTTSMFAIYCLKIESRLLNVCNESEEGVEK